MADNYSALRAPIDNPYLGVTNTDSAPLSPEEQYALTGAGEGEFVRGLRRGSADLSASSFARQALNQELAGQPNQDALASARGIQQEATQYAPSVAGLQDIHGLGDLGSFAAGQLGSSLPAMAPLLGGALLARGGPGLAGTLRGFAGAAVPAYLTDKGSAALEQYNDPEQAAKSAQSRDRVASLRAAMNAGLMSLVPGHIATAPGGGVLRKMAADAALQAGVGAGMTGLDATAAHQLNPNAPSPGAWDYANAAAGGALVGGAFGGAHALHGMEFPEIPKVGEKLRGLLPKGQEPVVPVEEGGTEQPPPSAPEERPGWGSLIDTLGERIGPKAKSVAGAAANTAGDVAGDLAGKAVDTYHSTLSRMNDAAKTAKNPADFLTRVFGSAEDDARLLGDDDPTLAGATPVETEQNLRNRDAERQARAEEYSTILSADPSVPPDVREKLAAAQQDLGNPDNQNYVIQQAVAHRAGQRIGEAAANLVDLGKQLGTKAVEAGAAAVKAVSDKIVRSNLEDTSPAERFTHTKMVYDNLTDEAKASPQVRSQMGKIGAALTSMAARVGDLDAEDVKHVPVLKNAMSIFKDPKAVAEQFSKLAGGDKPEGSFLSKVMKIESAVDDAKKPESFLFHSLDPRAQKMFPEGSKGLDHIAHFVDEAAAAQHGPARAAAVDRGLAQAFGTPEAARAVVEFYRSQLKDQLKIDLPEGVDESAGEHVPAAHGLEETEHKPTVAHFFDNNEKNRPFYGGQRVKGALRPITAAAMDLRQRLKTQGVNARVKSQSFHDMLTETGGNHEAEAKRLSADVQSRMDEHVKQFAKENGLKPEQAAKAILTDKGPRGTNYRKLFNQREELKDQGAEALKNHEVIRVEHSPEAESGASDEDLRQMRTLVKDPSAGDTKIKFQKANGKTLTLSAESIWKTMAAKAARRGETGDGENRRDYAKRLFAQGVSDILGRPDIKGMEDKPAQIDRGLNLWSKPAGKDKLTRQTLELSREGLNSLKSRLKERVDQYEEAEPDERMAIRDALEQNVEQIQSKLNAAENVEKGLSEGTHPLANNKPAQAVQRERLNMFKDALQNIREMDFQHALDASDEDRPGVVEQAAPKIEPINRPRSGKILVNEEQGPDRYEQGTHAADQALHEERVAQFKNPEQSAAGSRGFASKLDNDRALSDVALKTLNYAHGREEKLLKTPEDVLKYAAMAKQAMEQGAELPFKDLNHLEKFLKTPEQKALLKSIQDGTALVLTKRESLESRKGGKPISAEEQEKIKQEIWKQRGKDVQVLFRKFIGAEGSGTWSMERGKRTIELAINAVNPMGVAYHESLHDFFNTLGKSAEERQIKQDLVDASSAPQVMAKLREYFKDHKAALKQIEESPEERLAYTYQLYAEGHMNELGPTGKRWYNRLADFVRDLIGVISSDKRAQGIFDALLHGHLKEPSLVTSVIQDRGLQTFNQKAQRLAPPIYGIGRKLFTSAADRLHALNSPAVSEVVDKFFHTTGRDILAPDPATGELKVSKENAKELPFLQRTQMYVNLYNERLRKAVAGTTFAQRREAIENLQAMKAPSSPLEVSIDKLFKDIYKYMKEERENGIEPVMRLNDQGKWENLPKAMEHYFPRRWDKDEVENHSDEFTQLLQQHGGMDAASARAVVNAIVNSPDGRIATAENEHHLGYTPFSAAVNKRQLDFINEANAHEFTKFMDKDLMGTVASYINQAVHRKEYAHSFGNDGQWIRAKLAEARKQGLGEDELAQAQKAIAGLEGTLGHEINPRTRELFSGIMAYQNMVLLPLTIFSNMNDMMGIAMRSGEIRDSGKAFMQFVDGLKRAAKGDAPSEAEEVARTLGIISDENSLNSINEMYAGMGMTQFAKSLNNKFFKYNGMELWNRNMRTAATQAGMRFITRNIDNERYMQELGLEKKNVFQSPDGRLLVTKDQIAEHLKNTAPSTKNIDKVAQAAAEQVHSALFKFVDQAVLRPNAAHRPVWGSDPHYSLIFHLKQYTYSFQNVMIKRMSNELRHGNETPAMIMSSYVPFAIAAGIVRGSIAGTLNSTHDLYNIITQSMDRSGIGGVYTFKADAVSDALHGKVPGTSFLGPSFDHLTTLLGGLSGKTSLHDVAMRSLPLGAAFRGRFE